ncbi:nitroreductase family deazaflavin-dependent oxidoreductase [Mycobacteroides abscessus]|uniref:Hemerythrin n=1 Tax=Mycobacteroides abscessus subsp. massiliense TaxID=1962118 RepID=A0A1U1B598_9MYCO|nr:nitroreductase family deazaflavin-dependent oxidoreductase [Mycobacteroides abscessus]MBN7315974.1 nitroreductase family deazaflavin-dependent oxidoreductase [Mycobacteroides abscessus subsp. massiliense]MDM2646331.1 nitroreductase family deazaflavin-dependent oxidoreductase [Mycobacteroides abscessus]MDM2655218.1 nitroreductase family deazaflavin-dependent oxidoreductase [Mycobacteroides abscessus]MDM2665000.1 nitroreductase family deazaflavin-dependent oxidoreductase [Mycobacteroides absce
MGDIPPYKSFTTAQELDFNKRNIQEFRSNGGHLGGAFQGMDLLLLTSVGAKSGVKRTTPVGYFNIDGQLYVVGSGAGREKLPAWVANVRVNHNVTIEIGSEPPASATVHELDRKERDRIYDIIKRRAEVFAEYERGLTRLIPVFSINKFVK